MHPLSEQTTVKGYRSLVGVHDLMQTCQQLGRRVSRTVIHAVGIKGTSRCYLRQPTLSGTFDGRRHAWDSDRVHTESRRHNHGEHHDGDAVPQEHVTMVRMAVMFAMRIPIKLVQNWVLSSVEFSVSPVGALKVEIRQTKCKKSDELKC